MKYVHKVDGEKVYLSPMNIDDAPKYFEWMNDSRITNNLGNTNHIITLESEKIWITKMLEKGEYQFAIIKKENDELIGNCSFNSLDLLSRIATIGIFIGDEENRNKGLGSDAINALLKYGFNVLNLNNIMLEVFSFNERAIKCYKKVGFKEFGRRRNSSYINGNYYDTIYMDILKDEFYEQK